MQTTLERFRQRREEDHEGGFTLIELLIVIVILAILAAIVVFAVQNLSKSSSKASCSSDYKTVQVAVEAYKAQVGVYPGGTLPSTLTKDGTYSAIPTDWALYKATDPTAGIADLFTAYKDSAGSVIGPWLKTLPANSTHYSIGVNTGTAATQAGNLTLYNGTGTTATTKACSGLTN